MNGGWTRTLPLQAAVSPRAGDGERDAGRLEVGEQPTAVLGLERRPGPLRAAVVLAGDALAGGAGGEVGVVLGEREDVAVGSEAVQELVPAAVLAEHQA